MQKIQDKDHVADGDGQPVRGDEGRTALPLSECTEADLVNHHALVFGRVKVWHSDFTDDHELAFHWSNTAWWKGMWYPHRGAPSRTGTWGVYGGGPDNTSPGDAELTHWLPMPARPTA